MKILSIIIMFIIVNGMIFSTYGLESKNIVGIWLLDENKGNVVRDSSGNGHDGEIIGAVTWDNGKFGSALNFGGGNVVIPHHEKLSLEVYSITAWVKLVDMKAYQALVEKSIPGGTRNYYLAVTPEGKLYGGFSGDNGWNSCVADKVTDEIWHHVAVTYNMKSILTYVDSKSSSEITLGKEGGIKPLQNTFAVSFGTTSKDGGEPAKGLIDEVGIFNTSLTGNDIKNIMNNGLQKAALAVELSNKLPTTWCKLKK